MRDNKVVLSLPARDRSASANATLYDLLIDDWTTEVGWVKPIRDSIEVGFTHPTIQISRPSHRIGVADVRIRRVLLESLLAKNRANIWA